MHDQSSAGAIYSYRDLVAWQKALDLAEAGYVATRSFPKDETYGLTGQMRRAAVSVVSNIAEGHARQTRGEYIQFVGVARGSLAELQTQAVLAARLHILNGETEENLNTLLGDVGRLLNAARKSLLRRPPDP